MFPSAPIADRLRTWAATAVDVADAILTAQPPEEPTGTPDLHAAIHRGSRDARPAPRRPRRPTVAAAPAGCTTPLRAGERRPRHLGASR
jgi:hypothetical protein